MIKMKNKNCVYRDGEAEEKFDAWHYLQWITGTDAGMKNQIIYNKFCIYNNNLDYWIFKFTNSLIIIFHYHSIIPFNRKYKIIAIEASIRNVIRLNWLIIWYCISNTW